MKIKKKIYQILIIHFLFFGVNSISGQQLQLKDTLITAKPWPAIIRSAIIPGWGQIYQDRLWPATLFYWSSAAYAYKSIHYGNQYVKEQKPADKTRLQKNLSILLFFYTLNLLDVTDAAFNEHPYQWSGGLFSDKPLKSPWGAVLRSSILPGWGHVYTESYWKAAGYFLTAGYLAYRIREADIVYQKNRTSSNRNERSKYSWYFGLAYLINMADAYADAYLYKFDEAVKLTVSPNLSPDVQGIALRVTF